jgi:hypothetical protein
MAYMGGSYEMDLQETGQMVVVGMWTILICLNKQTGGSNEDSGATKCGEFLNHLRNYYLPK